MPDEDLSGRSNSIIQGTASPAHWAARLVTETSPPPIITIRTRTPTTYACGHDGRRGHHGSHRDTVNDEANKDDRRLYAAVLGCCTSTSMIHPVPPAVIICVPGPWRVVGPWRARSSDPMCSGGRRFHGRPGWCCHGDGGWGSGGVQGVDALPGGGQVS